MQIHIPIGVVWILRLLMNAGFEAYIVGGAVRDMLLNHDDSQSESIQPVTDFDFTTNALPEQILALFPEAYYENEFGTVSITDLHLSEQVGLPNLESSQQTEQRADQKNTPLIRPEIISKVHESLSAELPKTPSKSTSTIKPYEITTFRSDGTYADHRRPESVTWGKSLEQDLERRDFTVNAMAIQIDKAVIDAKLDSHSNSTREISFSPTEYQIIDPHAGMSDLQEFCIRTVGNPTERFQEDALRMLRAIRFSVQLNMRIDKTAFESITTLHHLLKHISAERIRDEFLKILSSQFPKEGLELLDASQLLQYIVPELLDCKGVQQAGHHTTDVWEHSLDALSECPSPDPIVRLATLLHDIGKPKTQSIQTNTITFYNHEVVGAHMCKRIAERLKLSKAETERLFLLVRYHMFHYQPEQTDAAIRRFMRKVGLENLNDILDLREADRLGSGARKTSWRLEEMKSRMIEQLNQPFSTNDLAVNGHDLMSELNLKPGKIIGQILEHLLEVVLEHPDKNKRDILLQLAQTYRSTHTDS